MEFYSISLFYKTFHFQMYKYSRTTHMSHWGISQPRLAVDAIRTCCIFLVNTHREWEWSRSRDVCSSLHCSVFGAQYAERGCSSHQWLFPPTLHSSACLFINLPPSLDSSPTALSSLSFVAVPPCRPGAVLPSAAVHDVREAGKKSSYSSLWLAGSLSFSALHSHQFSICQCMLWYRLCWMITVIDALKCLCVGFQAEI